MCSGAVFGGVPGVGDGRGRGRQGGRSRSATGSGPSWPGSSLPPTRWSPRTRWSATSGPATQPEGGAPALQVYISRLRKALRRAGGDDVLLTRPSGLPAGRPARLPRRHPLRGAGPGRAPVGGRTANHAAAAATLSEALALWRGPAYAGLADLPFARAEAARLEELRLGALEARLESDLACGREAELIGELASLTAEHPLRERLWALRMTALYRAGRQAEALRTYQDLRRHLGEELGIEPSEELRVLEGAILRQDARPGPHAPATQPRAAAVPAACLRRRRRPPAW